MPAAGPGRSIGRHEVTCLVCAAAGTRVTGTVAMSWRMPTVTLIAKPCRYRQLCHMC
jgi:hypothetical protein